MVYWHFKALCRNNFTHNPICIKRCLNKIFHVDSNISIVLSIKQRHILKDRRSSTAACLACCDRVISDRVISIEIVCCEEKNILYCAHYNSQGRAKISSTVMTSTMNQPRKDPFHLFSLSPLSPQFQRSHPSLVSLVFDRSDRKGKLGLGKQMEETGC
jgi:hypothetical protein